MPPSTCYNPEDLANFLCPFGFLARSLAGNHQNEEVAAASLESSVGTDEVMYYEVWAAREVEQLFSPESNLLARNQSSCHTPIALEQEQEWEEPQEVVILSGVPTSSPRTAVSGQIWWTNLNHRFHWRCWLVGEALAFS